jgi:hypothetical protein
LLGKIFWAKGEEDVNGGWCDCIMRSFLVCNFHKILLFSFSAGLLVQKNFASVVCFHKLCMITSLCSVVIIQRVKVYWVTILSESSQLPNSVGSFIILRYPAQLAIQLRTLHHHMSRFCYSEM